MPDLTPTGASLTASSGLSFLVCTLAVWRATRLMQMEDGPWNVIGRLRGLASKAHVARAIDCFYCLSLWTATPFAFLLARSVPEGLCLWLALSAAAILVQRVSEYGAPSPPVWSEEPAHKYEEVEL